MRQANRRGLETDVDDPILIPRFYCPPCRKTCASLPEAIPPHRWYLWDVQRLPVTLLLAGTSLNQLAHKLRPSRQTLRRWWQRLHHQFDLHASALRNRFVALGRWPDRQGLARMISGRSCS